MIFHARHRSRSDAELVARVAEGDDGAFSELLRRHQDAVYAFARRMMGDPQEAEDVTQEAFLRLYRAAGRYRQTASLRSYLFRIAKNYCIDRFRKRRPEVLDDLPDLPAQDTPLDLLENAITVDCLERAIDRLPVNQRTALLLRHTEQLSYTRIAEIMDLSVGAVESLLVRARQTLKSVLASLQE